VTTWERNRGREDGGGGAEEGEERGVGWEWIGRWVLMAVLERLRDGLELEIMRLNGVWDGVLYGLVDGLFDTVLDAAFG